MTDWFQLNGLLVESLFDRRRRCPVTLDDVLLHHGPHVGHLGLHHVELLLNVGINLLRLVSMDDLGHFSLMVGEDCDGWNSEDREYRAYYADKVFDFCHWHPDLKSIQQFEHIYIVSVFADIWFQNPGNLAGCSSFDKILLQ